MPARISTLTNERAGDQQHASGHSGQALRRSENACQRPEAGQSPESVAQREQEQQDPTTPPTACGIATRARLHDLPLGVVELAERGRDGLARAPRLRA